MLIEPRHKLGRHKNGLLVLAAGDADQAGVVGVEWQAFGVGRELVQQAADLGIGEFFVGQAREDGHLAAAGRAAPRGHIGGLVPVEDVGGRVEVAGFHEAGF